MVDRRYAVQLGGKTYSPQFQTDLRHASDWKKVLTRAYGSHAVCLCPGKGERKLSIKRREGSDALHLARFAGTGAQHANECRFYAPAPERSGMQGYTLDAVEEVESGFRVRLARGIRIQEAGEEARRGDSEQKNSTGNRKPAVTLLGLLHLLWTEGRLNVWYPAMQDKRGFGLINSVLRRTAERITVSRMPLDSVLMLGAAKDSHDEQRNAKIAENAAGRGHRLVLVSPLARFNEEKHEGPLQLPVSGPFGMPKLWLAESVWARVQRSFAREIAAWKRGSRVMAIAQFDTKPGSTPASGKVVDVGLMQVTERWIPVDSDYEAQIEERLYEQERCFEKPLRFDAGEEFFFPDFWLLDTAEEMPLEVFGMATPEYLERRQQKAALLNCRYGAGGWWFWDAAHDQRGLAIPDFPPANRRS